MSKLVDDAVVVELDEDIPPIVVSPTVDWASITGKPALPTQAAVDAVAAAVPEQARDALGAALVGGSNVTITANDAADTITVAVTVPAQTWASITGKPTFATVATSGSYTDLVNKPTIPDISGLATAAALNTAIANVPEQARDAVGAALVAGTGITLTVNDANDTITITATGGGGGGITTEDAQDAAASLFTTATHSGISFSYNDAANTLAATVAAQSWSQITGKPTFATVATSGSKADVGLGNVDNTSDANKPISTATSTALAAKAALAHTHGVTDLTATGVKDGTKFLRDDNTWAVAGSGGSVNLPESLAPAPSGGDDLAALQAAMPTVGRLILRAGTYKLSGRLTVTSSQDIWGQGGNLAGSQTVLQCTAAGAGLTITNVGSLSGNFCVDGNSVATNPFSRTLGSTGAQRTFLNISVINALQDNMILLGAQNDTWIGCNAQYAGRDNIVLDQGVGGNAFYRCEFNGATRYQMRLDSQITGGPYAAIIDNTFDHCIFEREHPTNGGVTSVMIPSTGSVDHCLFYSCSFYATPTSTGPRIDFAGTGNIHIIGGRIQGLNATTGGIGLRVVDGTRVVFSAQPRFEGLTTAIHIVSGNPTLAVNGNIHFTSAIGARYAGGGSGDVSVKMLTEHPVEVVRDATSNRGVALYVRGEAGVRLLMNADGSIGFNDGVGYTPKASLFTAGSNVLATGAANAFRVGSTTTAARPGASTVGAGGVIYDTTLARPIWSTGSNWVDASGTMRGVQTLTYAATVTPNLLLGSQLRVVLTGDITVNPPTGPIDGQSVLIEAQASGANRTLTFAASFETSQAVPNRSFTIPSGTWGYVTLIYRSTTWRLVSAEPQTLATIPTLPITSAWLPADNGMLGWTMEPASVGATLSGMASGSFWGGVLKLDQDALVSNIIFYVSGAAATVTSARNYAGIYALTTGNLLTQTGDLAGALTSVGVKTAPVTATTLSAGQYLIGMIATATTMPTIAAAASYPQIINYQRNTSSQRSFYTGATVYTALPATRPAAAGAGNAPWFGLS